MAPPPSRSKARVWAKYDPSKGKLEWARLGSNQRPTDYESAALPLSYRPSDGESIRGQIEALLSSIVDVLQAPPPG